MGYPTIKELVGNMGEGLLTRYLGTKVPIVCWYCQSLPITSKLPTTQFDIVDIHFQCKKHVHILTPLSNQKIRVINLEGYKTCNQSVFPSFH